MLRNTLNLFLNAPAGTVRQRAFTKNLIAILQHQQKELAELTIIIDPANLSEAINAHNDMKSCIQRLNNILTR